MTTYSVMTYGAVGDGSFDDTSAFNAAISAAGGTGGKVFVPRPPVNYKITAALTCPSGTIIETEVPDTPLKPIGAFDLFYVTGNNIKIGGFTMDCSGQTAGKIIAINTSADRQNIRFHDLWTYYAKTLIGELGSGAGLIRHLHLDRITCQLQQGPGTVLTRAYAFIYYKNVTIDYVSSPYNVIGHSFTGGQGIYMTECPVLGSVTGTAPGQHGFYFTNCEATSLTKCHADSVLGHGFYWQSGQYAYMTDCVASLAHGIGMIVNGTTKLNANGLHIDNCAGGGVYSLGGATHVIQGMLTNNAGFHYNLASAQQHVRNTLNSSGGLINVAGPGTA